MRPSTAVVLAIIALGLSACVSASRLTVPNCGVRSPASFGTIAPTLNRYTNCNQPTCAADSTTATYTFGYSAGWLWQGACSTTFTPTDQDNMIATAHQQASAHLPACSNVISWEYFTDFLVGSGSGSCVIGVKIHYQCCGGHNPQ